LTTGEATTTNTARVNFVLPSTVRTYQLWGLLFDIADVSAPTVNGVRSYFLMAINRVNYGNQWVFGPARDDNQRTKIAKLNGKMFIPFIASFPHLQGGTFFMQLTNDTVAPEGTSIEITNLQLVQLDRNLTPAFLSVLKDRDPTLDNSSVSVNRVISSGYRSEFGDSNAPNYGTWIRGDTIRNILPVTGTPVSWYCSSSGSPGTWQAGPTGGAT
jgi:hypothetical protein